jgi:hypothetical protein
MSIDVQFILTSTFTLLILLPQPTIWTTDFNHYLHLALLLRIWIVFNFLISYSPYCDERAYRIIKFNGLNGSDHLFFALKSIVESLNFAQILGIYVVASLFFAHCLNLVTDYESNIKFMDYYEIIITTMSTVGYG